MLALLQQPTPITAAQVIAHLRALRQHSVVESSQFAVSALLELELNNGQFTYVGGVNVENAEHNRLSLHAEQNALSTAQTLFGGNVTITKIWTMGGPSDVRAGSSHPLADYPVMSCGHCRQLLLSVAAKEAKICAVTINGKISPVDLLQMLLPKAFSEQDLALEKAEAPALKKWQGWQLLKQQQTLSNADIFVYLSCLSPHLINPQFQTSALTSCLLKLKGKKGYIPGVLVQDVAFLTTDAIFSAVGLAITQYSARELIIEALYLYSSSTARIVLTGSELAFIRRFAKADLALHFYDASGTHKKYNLETYLAEKTLAPFLA